MKKFAFLILTVLVTTLVCWEVIWGRGGMGGGGKGGGGGGRVGGGGGGGRVGGGGGVRSSWLRSDRWVRARPSMDVAAVEVLAPGQVLGSTVSAGGSYANGQGSCPWQSFGQLPLPGAGARGKH